MLDLDTILTARTAIARCIVQDRHKNLPIARHVRAYKRLREEMYLIDTVPVLNEAVVPLKVLRVPPK